MKDLKEELMRVRNEYKQDVSNTLIANEKLVNEINDLKKRIHLTNEYIDTNEENFEKGDLKEIRKRLGRVEYKVQGDLKLNPKGKESYK